MEKQYQDPEDLFANPLPRLRSLELVCTNCNSPIHGKNINIDTSLAHCESCGNTFQMEQVKQRRKAEIFMPDGIDVLRLQNELDIEFKWRRNLSSFLIFFALIWNGILFIMAMGIIISGNWGMLAFLSIHGSVGLGLLYYILTVIFNRTNIFVDRDYLRIEHRPLRLPFYSDQTIPIKDVEQVFVERYKAGKTNNVTNYAFAVGVILRGGKRLQIIKGFQHAERAGYIEQEIELFLQIDDEKVIGEWKGHILDR